MSKNPRRRRLSALVPLILLVGASAFAQTQAAPTTPPAQGTTAGTPAAMLRVFLDCDPCDEEYLRQNVQFVDYVRDRTVADLHVLVTTQETGGGGRSWVVKFIGQGRFQSQDRTLTFNTNSMATSDDRRKAFAKTFKLGLVPYAADTSVAPQLDVTYAKPATTASAAAARDPWNYWVFRISMNGDMNGEKSSKARSYSTSFSANRVTSQWKLNIGAY